MGEAHRRDLPGRRVRVRYRPAARTAARVPADRRARAARDLHRQSRATVRAPAIPAQLPAGRARAEPDLECLRAVSPAIVAMFAHLVRRFLLAIPVLLIASMLTFLLSRWSGASYFDQYRADPRLDPAVVREMERRAHFDQSPLVQYLNWLRGIMFDVRVFRPA